MQRASILLLVLAGLVSGAVEAQTPERRPCVARDAPAGCDAVPGAPGPPGWVPSPDAPARGKTVAVPLKKTPATAPPAPPPEGEVTVGPPPAAPSAAPPAGTVGPGQPKAPKPN